MPARLRALAALVVAVLLGAMVLVVGAVPAQATEWQPFTKVYSQNVHGDISIVGNTLETCVASAANCDSAQRGVDPAKNAGQLKNNDFTARYVDVDSDATTFNSSSATLSVPTDGSVLFAALVWSGRTPSNGTGNENPAKRQNVRFTTPDGVAHDVTGAIAAAPTGNPIPYQGYLDVTSLVSDAGSGSYTVANVQSSTNNTDRYAGWALVVALGDPNAPIRNLTVFKGFGTLNTADSPKQDFTVSGFITPPQGPVRTTLGVVSYEGDRGYVGDSLSIKGSRSATATKLSDGLNPVDDVFNSTISTRGIDLGNRNPNYNNQLGFDADLLSADGLLANGETSATLSLTTSQETYYPGVVTFATDLYDPKLNGVKTATLVTDPGADGPSVGDTLRYTVDVRNDGLDSAVDSSLFDAIPTGTSYVPGSLAIDGTPVTDQSGDDTGDFVGSPTGGHVLARIGTGATATDGGEFPTYSTPADQHRVAFDVTITSAVVAGQQLTNAADIVYTGKTTGQNSASVSNVVVNVVPNAPSSTLQAPNRVLGFEPTAATPSLTVDLLAEVTGGTAPVSLVDVTDAAGGVVVVNPDHTVTYTPGPTYAGRDVFTYTVEDANGVRKTATVKIDVTNTAPTAVNDAAPISRTQPTTVDPIANDTDPNGDAVHLYSVTANGTTITDGQTLTTASGGTLQIENGRVVYTPPAAGLASNAVETFTYVPADARGTRSGNPGTVTLTAGNVGPTAVDDDLRTLKNSSSPFTIDPRGNDSDPDRDTLTVTAVGTAGHGTVTFTGTSVSYTPDADYAGTDSFTYTVSDGNGGTATARVDVVVDGPPVANPDVFTAPVGSTTASGNVLTATGSADTDPNGDALIVTSVGSPSVGSVVWSASGSVSYSAPSGYVGEQQAPYSISDGTWPASSTVTFRIPNVVPTATASTATIPATTGGSIPVQNQVSDPNVTAGYQTFTTVSATADHGATATVQPNGSVKVVPAAGYTGPVTLTYVVSDGVDTVTSTVAITVDDNAPTALPDSTNTPTNTAVDVDVLVNDSDPDGHALTIVSVGTPVDGTGTARGTATIVGGKIRYTPPARWAGTVTFPYTIGDGQKTASSSVEVTVDNAPPTAVADSDSAADFRQKTTTDVLANDTDPNIPGSGQSLSVVSATADHGATVRIVPGGLEVTPATGYRGTIAVDYVVSDGAGGTAPGRLTVTVGDAPPTITPPVVTSTGGQVTVDLLGTSSDPNGDPITVASVGPVLGSDGRPHGTATLSGGRLTITPERGYVGTLTTAYGISDGQGGTTNGAVTFTVTAATTTATSAASTTPTAATARGGAHGTTSGRRGTGSRGLGSGDGRLAETGVMPATGMVIGSLLLGAGAALVALARRRRRTPSAG